MGVVVALPSTDIGFNVFFQKSNNLEAKGNFLSGGGVQYKVFVLVLFLWKLTDEWGNQNGDGKVYQLSVDWWEYSLLSLICCFLTFLLSYVSRWSTASLPVLSSTRQSDFYLL